MPIYLRQATASQEIPLGYFVDSADGNTEETGLTIANTDIKVWKAGATTLANKNSGGATHISNGIYYAVLDATDTDTIGSLVVFVHVAGALTVRLECVVLDEAVYDVQFGTVAPATATNITAGVITTVTTVNGLAAGVITSATVATGAIDADALATDAVAEIADGVWDEAIAGHLAAGSTGLALNSASSAGDPWATAVPGAYGAGTAGNLLGNNLTGNAFTRLGAPAGASVSADIAAIEAQTDDIGAAGAGLTALATQASVNTIDDFLDTEIAAIITTLGTPSNLGSGATVAANLVDIEAQTDDIGAAGAGLTAINLPNQTMDIVGNITGNLSGSVGSVTGAVGSVTGLTPATIAAAWLAAVVEGAHTLGDFMRLFAGVLTGKSSGGGTTTVVFRDVADTKNRVSATVDASGNRTAVGTRDGT